MQTDQTICGILFGFLVKCQLFRVHIVRKTKKSTQMAYLYTYELPLLRTVYGVNQTSLYV